LLRVVADRNRGGFIVVHTSPRPFTTLRLTSS
jgi:hypothetical protein